MVLLIPVDWTPSMMHGQHYSNLRKRASDGIGKVFRITWKKFTPGDIPFVLSLSWPMIHSSQKAFLLPMPNRLRKGLNRFLPTMASLGPFKSPIPMICMADLSNQHSLIPLSSLLVLTMVRTSMAEHPIVFPSPLLYASPLVLECCTHTKWQSISWRDSDHRASSATVIRVRLFQQWNLSNSNYLWTYTSLMD